MEVNLCINTGRSGEDSGSSGLSDSPKLNALIFTRSSWIERQIRTQQVQERQVHSQSEGGQRRVILTSQMYEAKTSALQGIESVRNNAPIDDRYERKSSSRSEPPFNQKATNRQLIGDSEMHSCTAAMEGGIASVRKNASDAKVADLKGFVRRGS